MSEPRLDAQVLFVNARLATMAGDGYGIVDDGAVAVRGGRIVWAGLRSEAPAATREHDCGGLWLTPGLVDCHTHSSMPATAATSGKRA
jgi:imidazolonepropionase